MAIESVLKKPGRYFDIGAATVWKIDVPAGGVFGAVTGQIAGGPKHTKAGNVLWKLRNLQTYRCSWCREDSLLVRFPCHEWYMAAIVLGEMGIYKYAHSLPKPYPTMQAEMASALMQAREMGEKLTKIVHRHRRRMAKIRIKNSEMRRKMLAAKRDAEAVAIGLRSITFDDMA